MKQSGLFQLAHLCQCIFNAHGLTVAELHDVNEYEERMVAIGKPERQRPFDSHRHIIPEHRTLAIILQDQTQDVTGILARHLDLGHQPLATLLDEEAAVIYGSDRPRRATCPAAQEIRGQVAYIGEMFAPKGERGKAGLAGALVRYIHCLAFSQWSLDWSYAFIKRAQVETMGRVTQYGFSIVEANAQDWSGIDDPRRDSSEYLVANSRKQFGHIIESCTRDPLAYLPGYKELHSNAKQMAAGGASGPNSFTRALKDQ